MGGQINGEEASHPSSWESLMETITLRLEKSVLRQKRPDLRAKFKPERVNLMPNEANLKLERAHLRFEGLNLLEMADLRSARTRFPLERLGEWL